MKSVYTEMLEEEAAKVRAVLGQPEVVDQVFFWKLVAEMDRLVWMAQRLDVEGAAKPLMLPGPSQNLDSELKLLGNSGLGSP